MGRCVKEISDFCASNPGARARNISLEPRTKVYISPPSPPRFIEFCNSYVRVRMVSCGSWPCDLASRDTRILYKEVLIHQVISAGLENTALSGFFRVDIVIYSTAFSAAPPVSMGPACIPTPLQTAFTPPPLSLAQEAPTLADTHRCKILHWAFSKGSGAGIQNCFEESDDLS